MKRVVVLASLSVVQCSLYACYGGMPKKPCIPLERVLSREHSKFKEIESSYQNSYENGVFGKGEYDTYLYICFLIKKYDLPLPANVNLPELLGVLKCGNELDDISFIVKDIVCKLMQTEEFDLAKAKIYIAKLDEAIKFADQYGMGRPADYCRARDYLQHIAAGKKG